MNQFGKENEPSQSEPTQKSSFHAINYFFQTKTNKWTYYGV